MTRTVLAIVPRDGTCGTCDRAGSPTPERISLRMGGPPASTALSPRRHPESRPGLAPSLLDDIYGRA